MYVLWKELRQLQPHDQQHKQLKTDNSLAQTSPPHEEFITEVREQLIQPPFVEQITSFQDSQKDFQVFNMKYSLNLHIPNVSIERIHSPPVVHKDQACTEFVNREERCLIVSHAPTQLKESLRITLPTHISTEDNNTTRTQIVEPTLGFTPMEIRCAQNEPKLTVPQLLDIESCKDYVKTLTNFGWYIPDATRDFPTPCTRGEKIS